LLWEGAKENILDLNMPYYFMSDTIISEGHDFEEMQNKNPKKL